MRHIVSNYHRRVVLKHLEVLDVNSPWSSAELGLNLYDDLHEDGPQIPASLNGVCQHDLRSASDFLKTQLFDLLVQWGRILSSRQDEYNQLCALDSSLKHCSFPFSEVPCVALNSDNFRRIALNSSVPDRLLEDLLELSHLCLVLLCEDDCPSLHLDRCVKCCLNLSVEIVCLN